MALGTATKFTTVAGIATDKAPIGALSHILSTGHHILPVYNWWGQRVTFVWRLCSTSARDHRQYYLFAISVGFDLDAFLVEQVDATPEARVGRTPAVRVIDRFRPGIASDGIVLVPLWYATPCHSMGRCREDKNGCQDKGRARRSWCHPSSSWLPLTASTYFDLPLWL